jgi:hypothetical protein
VSGFGGGGLLFAILYFTVPLAVVSLLVALVARRFLNGLSLIVITVVVAEAITLTVFVSGMAKSDFSLALIWPFFVAGLIIAGAWTIAVKTRSA